MAEAVWDDIGTLVEDLTPPPDETRVRRQLQRTSTLFDEALTWPDLGAPDVSYRKQPQKEQMVVGLFYELVGMNLIKGYKTIRQNTWDQYDAFTVYEIDKTLLGRRIQGQLREAFVRDRILIEFKLDAESVIKDIREDAKRWIDIDLLVCWSLERAPFENISIAVRELDPADVYYFGSTHELLFLGYLNVGRPRTTVLELKTFLARHLAAAAGRPSSPSLGGPGSVTLPASPTSPAPLAPAPTQPIPGDIPPQAPTAPPGEPNERNEADRWPTLRREVD